MGLWSIKNEANLALDSQLLYEMADLITGAYHGKRQGVCCKAGYNQTI